MSQKSVVVKVDLTNGDLHIEELLALQAEGWLVDQMIASTPGSILVILKKDD